MNKKNYKKGSMVLFALVFSGIFIMIFYSLAGFIFVQNKLSFSKENRGVAMQISEAGLDYYKWFLSHYPEDFQDGTGVAGPYEHEYLDPEGGAIGKFSLDIGGNTSCGEVYSVDIESTGWTYKNPDSKRVVYGKYARPSVAEYSYIINSDVWAGADRNIKGRYHSNGGIRMDGVNQSTVSSSVSEWTCTSSFGCSPATTVDGVFGSGPGFVLWEFPVVPIDFNNITLDLVNMKNIAQTIGVYLAPSGYEGYHIVLKNDRSFDVYEVTGTISIKSYSTEDGWGHDRYIISHENFVSNYALPVDCGLVFAEDRVWLDGVVSGKVTVASANLIDANQDTDIILSGNITYTTTDGTDGLTAVAEHSVLIPLNSPDDMYLSGIFIAQTGWFGRNYYRISDLPLTYQTYAKRNLLEMTGTIVSNGRVGTSWNCSGVYCSGYALRNNFYDRKQAINPPPLTPFSDGEYRFIEWREGE
ncbi:hypothetical protein KKG48_01015 [Patescibacteria group bacterium]|nr:hypothetical protein [Patescibacteria group bacterium]MCG2695263.1 hypothetical protein [Candidatus Parcubacteria bacterium]